MWRYITSIYIWLDRFYNNKLYGGERPPLILKRGIGFFGAREFNGAWMTLGVVYERHKYIYIYEYWRYSNGARALFPHHYNK